MEKTILDEILKIRSNYYNEKEEYFYGDIYEYEQKVNETLERQSAQWDCQYYVFDGGPGYEARHIVWFWLTKDGMLQSFEDIIEWC